MKTRNFLEKVLLFVIVFNSLFVVYVFPSDISTTNFSIKNVNGDTIPFIADYSFDSSPTNNLFLV